MNEIHIRTLELLHRLPCLSRQALHVLAITLRVQRIESQRRLTRTRNARDHDQLIPRNLHFDIPQIMLASPLNMNVSSLPQNRPIASAEHHPQFPQKVNPSKTHLR